MPTGLLMMRLRVPSFGRYIKKALRAWGLPPSVNWQPASHISLQLVSMRSFSMLPLWERIPLSTRLKPRGTSIAPSTTASALSSRQELIQEYWDTLTVVLSDLEMTNDEVQHLKTKRHSLQLTNEELMWLHARAYAGILTNACVDKRVTTAEAHMLHRLSGAFREIGWAPGDSLEPATGWRGIMHRLGNSG